MKINGFYFFIALFLGAIVLATLYSPLRYVRYLLPILSLLAFAGAPRATMDKRAANYFYTFVGFYAFVIVFLFVKDLITLDVPDRFFPNVIFIMGPLLFITFAMPFYSHEKAHKYLMVIFMVNVLVFLYEDLYDLVIVLSNIGNLVNALFSSSVLTESHLGYVFGFFVLYFFVQKYPVRYKVVGLFFLVLCFKRIVLGAVIICLGLHFLLAFTKLNLSRNRITWSIVGTAVNFAYVGLTYIIVAGDLDEWFKENTGYSTDRFLLGRQQFYTEAFEKAGPVDWFGVGIGKMDDIIIAYFGLESGLSMRLHSDILKNYFEFGVILFTVWLFLMYYKNLFSNKALLFLVYFNVLCLTDNAFIYFDVLFYFYLFILVLLHEENNPQQNLQPT